MEFVVRKNVGEDSSLLGFALEVDATVQEVENSLQLTFPKWMSQGGYYMNLGKTFPFAEMKPSLQGAGTPSDPYLVIGGAPSGSGPAKRPRLADDQPKLVFELVGCLPHEMCHGVDALEGFLADRSRLLPVTEDTYKKLVKQSVEWESLIKPACGDLALHFSDRLVNASPFGATEEYTLVNNHMLVLQTLTMLNDHAPESLQVNFKHFANAGLASATSSQSLTTGSRGEFCVVSRERMLIYWEDKVEGKDVAAAGDLMKKAIPLNHTHYCPVDTILGGSAAGKSIKLHGIDMMGKVHELSNLCFNTAIDFGRAGVLRTAVNMYRWLLLCNKHLPSSSDIHMPENYWYLGSHPGCKFFVSGNPKTVTKKWQKSQLKDLLDRTGSTYAAFTTAYSLGNATNCLIEATLNDLKESVSLTMPMLGPDLEKAPPRTPEEVRTALACAASSMRVLHQAGLVYRDPRSPNYLWQSTRNRDRVICIDLDLAAPSGAQVPQGAELGAWDLQTLDADNVYSDRGDLYLLGKLVDEWSAGMELPQDLLDVRARLGKPSFTAADVLQALGV